MVGGIPPPPLPVTTILSCFESFPAAFAALTVKLGAPAAVGVPEINPVLGFKLKPAGRLPLGIDQVIGLAPLESRY